MSDLPVDEVVRDAEALARQFSDGSNPVRDAMMADVICHVKALATEYERLQKTLEKIHDAAYDTFAYRLGPDEWHRAKKELVAAMGDIADDVTDDGVNALALHAIDQCEDDCVYCVEEERASAERGSPKDLTLLTRIRRNRSGKR